MPKKMNKKTKITPKEFFNLFSESSEEALYTVDYTNEFKKNINLSYKKNLDLNLLVTVIKILAKEGQLPSKYKAHPLKGYAKKENKNIMECHIQPVAMLICLTCS
jgi:mRNA interferase YafQ